MSRTNTNLWWATRYPKNTPEEHQRAFRLWDYIEDGHSGVLYKDIRRDLGLSYWQTVRAVGMLCYAGVVEVRVVAMWNGQHWIHPHAVCIAEPPSL